MISAQSLTEKIREASVIFSQEPSLLALPDDRPLVFVGDTHGDYENTQEVFRRYADHRIVFLGDYVDRALKSGGSILNVDLLLDQKIAHPDTVILLRGNHEFSTTFRRYGFSYELQDAYGEKGLDIITTISECFSQMPYVATTSNGIIGMHGGLPNVSSRKDIIAFPKGIVSENDHALICQTVWNDNVYEAPLPGGKRASPRYSNMDFCFVYGDPYFTEKMALLESKVLVRGHDAEMKGYSLQDRVLTIFTSRAYNRGRMPGWYVAVIDPQVEIVSAKDLRIDPITTTLQDTSRVAPCP